MFLHRTPLAWAAALALALPLPSQAQAPEPAPSSATAPALELHAENPATLQGVKKVALASFGVYVLHEFEAGSTAQGGSTRGGIVSTHANMKVVGLEDERLQALADALYLDTVQALRAQGIEVLDLTGTDSPPALAALKAAADTAPLEFDARGGKGRIYSARGLPLLHVSEMGWLHRSSGGLLGGPKVDEDYVSLGDKMSVGFRLTQLQPLLRGLAEATQAPLLHVRLVLAPGGVQASKGGFFASSSSTQTTSTLVLPAFTNRLLLTTAEGQVARVSLNRALLSEQGLGELADVTSTAETAGNVALAAFSILAAASGHGRAVVNNSRKQELRTTPETFDAVARSQSQWVLQALAARLAAP